MALSTLVSQIQAGKVGSITIGINGQTFQTQYGILNGNAVTTYYYNGANDSGGTVVYANSTSTNSDMSGWVEYGGCCFSQSQGALSSDAVKVLNGAYNATVLGMNCVGAGWAVQGTAAAASAPVIAKPFSTPGSSGGTSVASSLAGDFRGTPMTVPVGMPGTSTFRWTTTANWGRAAGRMLPYVGTAVGLYAINKCLGG